METLAHPDSLYFKGYSGYNQPRTLSLQPSKLFVLLKGILNLDHQPYQFYILGEHCFFGLTLISDIMMIISTPAKYIGANSFCHYQMSLVCSNFLSIYVSLIKLALNCVDFKYKINFCIIIVRCCLAEYPSVTFSFLPSYSFPSSTVPSFIVNFFSSAICLIQLTIPFLIALEIMFVEIKNFLLQTICQKQCYFICWTKVFK